MNSLRGIGLFALQVIGLVSAGKKETIAEIERHFESRDLVEYLYRKYAKHFYVSYDGDSPYDSAALNFYFFNYCGYIEGNESRKYGIVNDNDGLLLIPALLMDKVNEAETSWMIDFEK